MATYNGFTTATPSVAFGGKSTAPRNGFTTATPSVAFGGKSTAPRNGTTLDPGGTVTYFYRASNGTRGSTTDLGAVPAGAVIERTVTT